MIIKSQIPAALVGKGPASASSVAWTRYQKYAIWLLLYRQEKDWKQYGAQVSRTTFVNWIIYCSQKYFQPMYDYFHRKLLKRRFAMADEKRAQMLNEKGRKVQPQSFMWLFRNGEDGLPVLLLYGYSPNRSDSQTKEFLDGYSGYLETDGYQRYNSLPGANGVPAGLISDAVPKGNQYDYSQPAVQDVQCCNRLFAIEDSINKKYPGDYEKCKQLHLEKGKPVLEAFWSWFNQQKPVLNNRMAKAHNLNIYGYLKFLLEHRPNQNTSDEQLAELAPWNEKLQAIKNRM